MESTLLYRLLFLGVCFIISGFKITITFIMNAAKLLYVVPVPKEGYVNRFIGRYV